MADLSDVTAAIAALSAAACYPCGTGKPSVTGKLITIEEGWPKPGAVDAAIRGSEAIVSVYPMPGASPVADQAWERARVVEPPCRMPGEPRSHAPLGKMGQVIHNERALVQVIVWAPNHPDRSKVAAAIDVACKSHWRLTMPDTSQALLSYQRTTTVDNEQNIGVYRRDLVYMAEYATVDVYEAREVLDVQISIDDGTEVSRELLSR